MRYYEESQGESDKNRYVYNRVGDFPIVQLKKIEIKRNLVRSSSVRIAPPNKSIMNRDIRAAILRSNSFQLGSAVPKLLPTKMRAKDDSHQIILDHEPLPINESAQSAKSVLDALEKNCRKRINNEELTLDRNKRVCATQEVVDAPSRDFIPIAQQSVKRGRDQVSPAKSNGDSPNSQLRKRSRIRNNALLSSLSSSVFLVKPFHSRPSLSPPKPSASVTSTQTKPFDETEPAENQSIEVEAEAQAAKSPAKPEPATKRLYLFNRKIDTETFHSKIVDDDDDDEEAKINFVKPRETKSNADVDIARHFEKDKLAMMLSGLSDGFQSPTDGDAKDSVDSVPALISFTTSTTVSSVAPITSATSSNPLLPLNITSTSSLLVPAVKTTETAVPTSTPSTEASKPVSEAVKSLPTFQFGNTVAVSSVVTTTSNLQPFMSPVSTAASALQTVPAGKESPAAIFSTPTQAKPTSTPSVDQNKPLISFTPISKDLNAASSQSVASTSNSILTNSVAPSLTSMSNTGFSFGSNKEPAATSNGFSFGSNMSSSGFGNSSAVTAAAANPVVTTASPLATTSPPSFGFQAPTTTAFSFGAKPANVATTAAPASGLNTMKPISFPGALSNTVSFLEKPATTTASGVGFSFNSAPSVNAAALITSPNSGFSFGSSQNAINSNPQAPITTANSAFSFGASNNTSSMFGQPQSQIAPQQSGFPSFTQKVDTPPSGIFSFGQKTAAPVVTTAPLFPFGSSQAAPTQQSSGTGFSFGQSNTFPIQPTPAKDSSASGGIFQRLGEKTAEAKSAFNFGGSNQAQQTNVASPFGNANNNNNNNNSQAANSLFGSSGNSAFNQTSSSSSSIFGGSQSMTQNNDFGGNTKPSNGGMFAFGASNNNQQQAQPSATMFDFGNQADQQRQVAQPLSIFDGNSGQNVSASYTFKPSSGAAMNTNSAPTNVFGQTQNSSSSGPPAYHQFGNQIGNNVSTSFTFGGASANSAQQNAPQSKGFNFNGPQTAPVAGAFNFQAAQPSLTPQPSSGGLFNIGTGGSQQQRRPMRQATRRNIK